MEKKIPIGLRFSLLNRSFRKKMDAMLSEKELTGVQFGTLGALVRMEMSGREEISQRDLEQATHTAHPTMTEILQRLEKKGFLRCETSEKDHRRKSIRSTEKAIALRSQADQVEEETFRWLCRGIPREQIDQFLATMDLMLANAWADCGKGCEDRP